MVNEFFLILCIPITLFIGCYFTLQGYKLGVNKIKNNEQQEEKEEFEIPKVNEEQQKAFQEMINEYLGM